MVGEGAASALGSALPPAKKEDAVKTIACGDLVPGCPYKARAESEAALMKKVSDHVRTAHPDVELTPKMVEAVKAKMKDEPQAA